VLVVVEHRKQDVEVVEQIGQPELAGEPSGSRSRRTRSSPPRAGTAGSVASSGIDAAASSGRCVQVPAMALLKTPNMATDMNDDATYGRSLT
jgi:hypothetical protein